jgi:hypothetical protein
MNIVLVMIYSAETLYIYIIKFSYLYLKQVFY